MSTFARVGFQICGVLMLPLLHSSGGNTILNIIQDQRLYESMLLSAIDWHHGHLSCW